jgi:hypothetical protein
MFFVASSYFWQYGSLMAGSYISRSVQRFLGVKQGRERVIPTHDDLHSSIHKDHF